MARVLVVGLCPLPFENANRLFGPGIRTWQFARPLLDDGHDVCLVTGRMAGAYSAPAGTTTRREGRLVHHAVDDLVLHDGAYLQRVHDEFVPDAIVGATITPTFVAVSLKTDAPIWADVFGDVMSEAQAKAQVYGDDAYVFDFWRLLRPVLDRGDVFSSVSGRQGWALVGALGTRGRLNRRTLGYSFVHAIPCAVDVTSAPSPSARRVLRGVDVGEDDFVVLWSGSYNTWTDVECLFAGLEDAMARDPRVRFVSTGGEVAGHDEVTYPRFLDLIAASPYRRRFIMKGWLPTQEVPGYWAEADVGIHLDRPMYERELGSENRVLSWMGAGLAVVASNVSELSAEIARHDLGLTFPPGDPGTLAETLLTAAADRERNRERAERARAYARRYFSYEETTRPLRAWLAHGPPRPAPDRGHRVRLEIQDGRLSFRQRVVRLRASIRARGALATGQAILQKRLDRLRRRWA
jgi:glycosyltransferase involved in cell wall biosynthesis